MAEDPLSRARPRVFLAIPLYEIFHHDLDSILEPLRRRVSDAAWVLPEQIHLTLHFFGSTPLADIDRIDASMERIASLFSPLKLSLAGIGGFPSLERPDILWLSVEEKSGELLSLQKAIQHEAKRLGFKIEARPFQPHATIARIKKRTCDLRTLSAGIFPKFPVEERTADHFVLFQSRCLPEGARYGILKIYSIS